MGYLAIILKTIVGSSTTVLQRNYQRGTAGVKNSLDIYMVVAHLFAVVFLFILAKGSVPLNLVTFLFAIAYGASCGLSAFLRMVAYKKTTLVYIAVFSGGGQILIPFIFELLRGDDFAAVQILSVLLRVAAVFVPLLFHREKFTGLWVCISLLLIGGTSTVIQKLFAENTGVTSESSFFFWTNVVILPVVFLMILRKNSLASLKNDLKKIKFHYYMCIMAPTAISNLVAYLGVFILRSVSATMYSVLSSACGLLATTALSGFLYKETLTKQAFISVLLSILSIILGVF